MKKRVRSENPPPGSRLGLTRPESGWRRGIHWHWRSVNGRACSSRYFLEPLPHLVLYFSSLCPCHGPFQATWSKGLQKIEFAVAGSQAKSLYDILQVSRTWPQPSMSGGLPLPKRHRCVPTTMASSLTAQELQATASDLSAQEHGATALDPTAQGFKGDMSEQGALPYLSTP